MSVMSVVLELGVLDLLEYVVMKIRQGLVAVSIIIGTCVTISAVPVQALTCQETGENCVVGERGPKGGVIFYDAGSQQWWGRYLEAEIGLNGAFFPWGRSRTSIFGDTPSTKALQRRSMAIGMGRENTLRMVANGSPLAGYLRVTLNDWYLPSKDELDALYNFRVQNTIDIWGAAPVWSSSESEPGYAWYQLFQDGTQFTDAQGILSRVNMNSDYLRSPVHTGSDFESLPMNFVRIRSFPNPGSPPPFDFVNSVRENAECSTKALNCTIGDRGPAGGIVVYDAGSDQQWGRYLEIAPQSCEIVQVAFRTYATVGSPTLYTSNVERSKAKAIGMGAKNTTMLAGKFAGAAKMASDSTCNNYSDWFLPSKDELNEAFRQLSHSRTGLQLTPVGGFARGYYWTSSDYDGHTAWSQYFADGQQFDRVQTLSRNKQAPNRPLLARPMRAFKSGVVGGGGAINLLPIEQQSIEIRCERTTVSGKPGVRCEGVAKGFSSGTSVIPYFRFPGETTYTAGLARPEISSLGTFEFSRKTGKKIYIYFTSLDGSVSSNRTITSAYIP